MKKVLGFVLLMMVVISLTLTITASSEACESGCETKKIKAKALIDHECNSSEWHFVITQVSSPDLAPDQITVIWENGANEKVNLGKVSGKVAHYTTTSNLNSPVTKAYTQIYKDWSGQFNLSHGPCDPSDPTPTPKESTSTPIPPTSTPTPKESTSTPIPPTSTPTPTSTRTGPTNTPTKSTPTPSSTPKDPATDTPTPEPTKTKKPKPTRTVGPTLPASGGGPPKQIGSETASQKDSQLILGMSLMSAKLWLTVSVLILLTSLAGVLLVKTR